MTHTNAPWQWDWRKIGSETHCGVFHESKPGQAYSVARCPKYQTKKQWAADARLIAAAPELLETLQRALDGWGHDFTDDMRKQARAAIARATNGG